MKIGFAKEIKEDPKKDQIYHIVVIYQSNHSPSLTGHMVMARNPTAALDIANKHKIGYPMGISDDLIRYRRLWQKEPYPMKMAKKRQGKIWCEDKKGNLTYYANDKGD
jgi:hypothetical protein